MPLVRRTDPATTSELTAAPPPQPPPESRELLLKWLAGRDADARRRAARALSRDPDAAPMLAARVAVELEPAVREALFDGIVGAGGMPAADLLAPLLRSPDAGLRGGAVEGLKQLMEAAVPAIDALLGGAATTPGHRVRHRGERLRRRGGRGHRSRHCRSARCPWGVVRAVPGRTLPGVRRRCRLRAHYRRA